MALVDGKTKYHDRKNVVRLHVCPVQLLDTGQLFQGILAKAILLEYLVMEKKKTHIIRHLIS